MEAMVLTTSLARRGRSGHWFSVENVVAGHRAMNRGKGVGIEMVAGLTEEIIAGAWCMVLAEAVGSGEKVKDKEIGFGACGFSDVKETGGDGWDIVWASEQGVAAGGSMGDQRWGGQGHGGVGKPGLIERDGPDGKVRVARVVGPVGVGE